MADIFSEVEEELRRDKYNTLLRRYGLPILAAVAVFILGVLLYETVWKPWRDGKVFAVSDAYDSAVALRDAGRTEAADAAFAELAAGDQDGYAALALIQQAEIAADAGDASRAADLYVQAADRTDDEALAGLARIKALYAMADVASYDEVLAQAGPLTDESPYQFSAREVVAAAALRAGDLDRARREYQYLTLAPETPSGIRVRATEGLAAVDRASAPEQDSEESPS